MKTFLMKTCLVLAIFFMGVLIGSFHNNKNWQEPSSYKQMVANQKEEPAFSFFEKDEAEVDLYIKKKD